MVKSIASSNCSLFQEAHIITIFIRVQLKQMNTLGTTNNKKGEGVTKTNINKFELISRFRFTDFEFRSRFIFIKVENKP